MANVLILYHCPTHKEWEHLQSSSVALKLTRPCPKCRKPSEIADAGGW